MYNCFVLFCITIQYLLLIPSLTQEEAVRVLQEAEALGLSLGKQLAVTRKDGETVSTSAASETIGKLSLTKTTNY